jgi:hypothetical protein
MPDAAIAALPLIRFLRCLQSTPTSERHRAERWSDCISVIGLVGRVLAPPGPLYKPHLEASLIHRVCPRPGISRIASLATALLDRLSPGRSEPFATNVALTVKGIS